MVYKQNKRLKPTTIVKLASYSNNVTACVRSLYILPFLNKLNADTSILESEVDNKR